MTAVRSDGQDRHATREAATVGVEDSARQARLATERAARLREEQHQERRELAEKRRLTFQQKVCAAVAAASVTFPPGAVAEGSCGGTLQLLLNASGAVERRRVDGVSCDPDPSAGCRPSEPP